MVLPEVCSLLRQLGESASLWRTSSLWTFASITQASIASQCNPPQGFWAHHAEAPLVGRNAIVASVCPQLHGMFQIKLALLLMLIGGLTRVAETGMHIRGDIHMLLVGDPGTGAQFLRAA